MFYCYRRLNLLEDSIINQGKILQNLIINLQSSNSGGSAQKDNNEDNAHPEESLNKETFDSFINPLNKKINVSDDDDDSSNSDFSENEENYEEDGTENLNNIKSIILKKQDSRENIDYEDSSAESLSIDGNSDDETINIEENKDLLDDSIIGLSNNDSHFILELEDRIQENNLNENNLNEKDENEKDEKDEKGEKDENENNVNELKKNDNKIKGLSKMKVEDLKVLVAEKNLTLEEDINSMKKAELIKILTN